MRAPASPNQAALVKGQAIPTLRPVCSLRLCECLCLPVLPPMIRMMTGAGGETQIACCPPDRVTPDYTAKALLQMLGFDKPIGPAGTQTTSRPAVLDDPLAHDHAHPPQAPVDHRHLEDVNGFRSGGLHPRLKRDVVDGLRPSLLRLTTWLPALLQCLPPVIAKSSERPKSNSAPDAPPESRVGVGETSKISED